jgi:predicted PurR-regulated permease PerM
VPDADGPAPPGSRRSARRPALLQIELDISTFVMVGVAVLVALLVVALFQGAPATITRIFIALLFTLALDPIVVAVERRLRMSRRAAVALVGSVFAIVMLAVVLIVGPAAVRQAREFGEELPRTIEQLYDLPLVGDRLRDAQAADKINEWIDQLPARVDANTLGTLADSFIGGIGAALTVIVFTLGMLLDGEVLVARMRNVVPPRRREQADRLGRLFYGTVGSYFAGSIFVAVLNGTFVLSYGLVLGVPLAPVAAIWSMVTNLIPQIGGFLGGSFFVLLAFTQGPMVGLLALAGYVVYLNVENNVLQPAIIGKSLDLSPPTTMVAALIGGAVAGVPGAMAVTPLVGTAKAIYKGLRSGEEFDAPRPKIHLPFHLPFLKKKKGVSHGADGDSDATRARGTGSPNAKGSKEEVGEPAEVSDRA